MDVLTPELGVFPNALLLQKHMAPKKFALRLIAKHCATYGAESAQNCGGVEIIFTSFFLF